MKPAWRDSELNKIMLESVVQNYDFSNTSSQKWFLRWQLVGRGGGRLGGGGIEQKGKGLMDMDNSVVIAGGRGYKGTKW